MYVDDELGKKRESIKKIIKKRLVKEVKTRLGGGGRGLCYGKGKYGHCKKKKLKQNKLR